MLIDTHCHLDFPEFDHDLDVVIKRAEAAVVKYIINIGSSLKGSQRACELAQEYSCVWATVGIHPHEADTVTQDVQDTLHKLAGNTKVVAVGEIGLDYYKHYSQPQNQMSLFMKLAKLGKDLDLPLIIHSRQSYNDTLKVLGEFMPLRAVVHCFSGNEDFLKACLDLGFFVSFTCNVTYKKADNLRSLIKMIPLGRLMLETDAPFLAPEGFRGRRCEPAYVALLAEAIAQLRGIPIEEVSRMTTTNARNFFNLS